MLHHEENIISDPGLANTSVSYLNGPLLLGTSYSRWIYKEDDRFAGTSLPDGNNTQVSLMGLDVDDTTLFPLYEISLGARFSINQDSSMQASVARRTVEFNFGPDKKIPSIGGGDESYHYYRTNISGRLKKGGYEFYLGGVYGSKDHTYKPKSNDQAEENCYYGEEKSIFAMISTAL